MTLVSLFLEMAVPHCPTTFRWTVDDQVWDNWLNFVGECWLWQASLSHAREVAEVTNAAPEAEEDDEG
jgi:hypothetical protein